MKAASLAGLGLMVACMGSDQSLSKCGLGADRGHHDEELVRLLAQVTAEVFAGDARLEELHEAWVRVIGTHMRGGGWAW